MATTFLVVKNDAISTLASGINDSVTSLDVAAGEGALFPSTYPFHISIDTEILSCTNRSTDTLTVTRHQQGTSAAAHSAAAAVELRVTAQSVTDLNTAVNTIENAKGAASGLASLNVSTKVVEQPASISDHLDDTAGGTNAEVTKAPTSNVMYDHGALTTAHGAVSVATASKIVVRDASANAKFAAPSAAGDALIKGTAQTITEMAALTTGKIWQGVANRPSEVDLPGGGATLTVAETEAFSGTSPNSFTDLDLHTIVGSQATLVILKVFNSSGTGYPTWLVFRKNGDSEPTAATSLYASNIMGAPASSFVYVVCITDTGGIVEWCCSSTKAGVTVDVVAYIK